MGVEWVDGTLQTIPVRWMRIDATIPMAPGKELLTATLTGQGNITTSGIYTYWDNFLLRRNLFAERVLANRVTYVSVDPGTAEQPVFGAVTNCYIARVHIVPQTDIIGADPALVLTIENTSPDIGGVVCTKTFDEGTNGPEYELTPFGPVDPDTREMTAGYGLKLEVTGTGSLPECLIVVEWNLL